MNIIRRFLSEPLVHFIAIGAALFVLYGLVVPKSQNSDTTIVVSVAMQENIAARFQASRQRPPTSAEMDNLVQNFLREEVLYRQAVALGFDQNDTVVRGRMRQKMEFIADSGARLLQPEEAELQAVLDADPVKFSRPGVVTFRQVFLGERPGDAAVRAVEAQLGDIGLSGDFADLGVRTLLPHDMGDASRRNIGGVFGPDFAEAVEGLEIGEWLGPVTSAYGQHFVYVSGKTDAVLMSVDDIRDTLVNEWRFAKTAEIKDKQFSDLLEKYDVVIESGDAK